MARGSSPLAGDRNHLHHLFERRFGWRVGLVLYLILAALPIFAVMAWPRQGLLIFSCGSLAYLAVVVPLARAQSKPVATTVTAQALPEAD